MSSALDLQQIIKTSRNNNNRVSVTGFLMHDGTYFVQALEGMRSAVTNTYNRIAGDPRHTNFHLISCTDVKERLFPAWSMGLLEGMSPEARARLLTYFTVEGINPNIVTVDRLMFLLQTLSAEVRSPDYRVAAE